MSTRSQIGIYKIKPSTPSVLKEFKALLYRHSDGYPSGVLPDIIPFLRWFKSARGIGDTEYVAARLLQWLCNQYDGVTAGVLVNLRDNVTAGYTGTLGHGICKYFHGDIEYYYAVYPNGVDIYDCLYDSKPDKWRLLAEINLDDEVNVETIIKAIG